MNKTYPLIFGIGNPLVDVVIQASESDLINLELNKGTMELVDEDRQKEIISYFKGKILFTFQEVLHLTQYWHVQG